MKHPLNCQNEFKKHLGNNHPHENTSITLNKDSRCKSELCLWVLILQIHGLYKTSWLYELNIFLRKALVLSKFHITFDQKF